jgi:hypothetical protein
VGDNNQLPIVNGKLWLTNHYVAEAKKEKRFKDHPLTKNHRQNTDPRFAKLLDDILDKQEINARFILKTLPECALQESDVDYTDASILNVAYTNHECDQVNLRYLDKMRITDDDTDNEDDTDEDGDESVPIIPINDGINMKGIANVVKIGCRLVIRHNYNNLGIFNGTKATLLKISGKKRRTMHVQLTSSDRVVKLSRVFNEDKSLKFFPVSLGYCVTIHCCQGMTLDNIIIRGTTIDHSRVNKKLWYVALSRTRTLRGVKIILEDITTNYADYDEKVSYGKLNFQTMVLSYISQDADRAFNCEWEGDQYITSHFINYLWKKSRRCALCNMYMNRKRGSTQGSRNKQMTVDRIDDNKPHLMNNCVLACYECNVSHRKDYGTDHPSFR